MLHRTSEIPERTHKAFCSLPFTKLILNGWGDVSMCCYQLTQLGNILGDTTVMELWNSDLAKDIRSHTLQNQMHPVCKSWNTCPYLVKDLEPEEFRGYKNYDYPTYLEICLPNTHCNIGGEDPGDDNSACIMCCRNYDFHKQPPITDKLCEKARPLMPYLKHLCVLGVAEPFWKDALFRVFGLIGFAEHKHHIRFTTNTNVTCLTEKVIERYFDEVMESDMQFSVDAGSVDTYQKIRRIDAYNLVVRNIRYYMMFRDRNGGPQRHQAIIYNNINLINVHEMVKMVEMAAELRIDKVIMLPTHDQCGRVHMNDLLLNPRNLKIFKDNSEKAMRRAQQLGVPLFYSKPFDRLPPPVGQELMPSQELVQLNIKAKNDS
jgi:hypothetical protein